MVYVEDWDEFLDQCRKVYESTPERARYVHKFRGQDKQLVLKVTNDVVVS